MSTAWADDFEAIAKARAEIVRRESATIRGECRTRNGGVLADCWCYRAGPDGSNLPCPPLPDGDG
jgi:hypothetical protein